MSSSTSIEQRRTFGQTLVEHGRTDDRVVVLDNDSGATTMAALFEAEFPHRFFDLGIAEKNLFGTAAGLAASGFVPIATTFAVFAVRCALDQIAVSIAYPGLNVKMPGHYIGSSRAGASHGAIEDLAVMRTLPNVLVADPADNNDLVAVMDASLAVDGPVYYRVAKLALPDLFAAGHRFQWGTGIVLRTGTDVTLCSSGLMTHVVVRAAQLLEDKGIDAEVLHLASIKPIDRALIAASVGKTGCAVTAEYHSTIGGLGSAVADVLVEEAPCPLRRIGFQDVWMHSGGIGQIMEHAQLTAIDVVRAAQASIAARSAGEGRVPQAFVGT